MAAEYRIYEDAVLGTGAFVVKASNISPEHGVISRDNPMDIEVPRDHEPSLRWEPLNQVAHDAMDALVAKKDADGTTYRDGHGKTHTDTGTRQREKFARFNRTGEAQKAKSLGDQGFTVKPKPKAKKKVTQAAMSESHGVPTIGQPKKAI